jgi:hypothetical protein
VVRVVVEGTVVGVLLLSVIVALIQAPFRLEIVARKLVLVYNRRARLPLILVAALRGNLRLRAAQVYLSAVHLGLLHILNQMLGHGLVLKSDEAKPAAGAGCGLLYNLDLLHKSILAEKPTQLFLSQVVINATNKHLVPRANTLAAATLRLLLLAFVATLTIVPVTRGPISATTAAASAATLSPIRLTLLFNCAFRRLRNQKTIRGLVAIALSYLDIPAADRVAVFLEHDAIKPIALCLVVAVNFESNKRKAA